MTTTTRSAAPKAPRSSSVAGDLRLDVPSGQARRPRLSWVAMGLVLVLAASLAGAITIARVADREPVLALGATVARGDVITQADLVVVQLATEDQLLWIPADQRESVVGMVAAYDLVAGTLLSTSSLRGGPTLPDGWSVVGLALGPGQYPLSTIGVGDHVEVVRTPDPSGLTGDGPGPVVLTREAEVFSVERLNESTSSLLISLAVPADVAPLIAAAAAEGRVRLVLLDA